MLASTNVSLAPARIAEAFAKAARHSARTWLYSIRALAFHSGSRAGLPCYADADVLAQPFTFQVKCHANAELGIAAGAGHKEAFRIESMCERKLARAVAVLAATEPLAFGRISEGKGTVTDCATFLQLAVFGFVKHDPAA
jgi:hypothetical protein